MKKEYMAPAIRINDAELEALMNPASITNVDGDADIEIGTGETPTEADARYNYRSVWDD